LPGQAARQCKATGASLWALCIQRAGPRIAQARATPEDDYVRKFSPTEEANKAKRLELVGQLPRALKLA
jgi:hypothetical protein